MERIMWTRITVIVTAITALAAIPAVGGKYDWGPTTLLNDPINLTTPFGTVVTDPLDPNTVWAVTTNVPDPLGSPSPADGLFKSTDAGETWTQMNDGNLTEDINVLDLAIDPTNSNIVYAATNIYGVFKTTDGGATWATVNNGITHKGLSFPETTWGANAIAIDPSDPNIVYVAVSNINNIDIGLEGPDHPGFYKSTDGGEAWYARNDGLPPRHDPLDDLLSHTVSVTDIVVIPQKPNIVLIGLLDIELNAKLLTGKTAYSKGRVFVSMNKAEGPWSEKSNGLPEISQSHSSGALTRICASAVFVAAAETGPPTAYASHTGFGIIVYLEDSEAKSKSKGVYKWGGTSWVRKSDGLPVISDGYNDNATNACGVCIAPKTPEKLLVGISASDAGDPYSDNSKVYMSPNGGNSWSKNWDQGMSDSPHGYTEASVLFLDINANQTKAFASVMWNNIEGSAGNEDDGIWRLPPLPE
jgi:hypothetical protein